MNRYLYASVLTISDCQTAHGIPRGVARELLAADTLQALQTYDKAHLK